jgi:hypothetical protein
MKVTKHNVGDIITSYLVKNKIRFAITDEDSSGMFIALYVGSLVACIMVEYDLENDNDDNFIIQMYVMLDSIHRSELDTWDSDTYTEIDSSDIEFTIEALIVRAKELVKVWNDISELISSIVGICDSNKLDPSIFIPNYKKF